MWSFYPKTGSAQWFVGVCLSVDKVDALHPIIYKTDRIHFFLNGKLVYTLERRQTERHAFLQHCKCCVLCERIFFFVITTLDLHIGVHDQRLCYDDLQHGHVFLPDLSILIFVAESHNSLIQCNEKAHILD